MVTYTSTTAQTQEAGNAVSRNERILRRILHKQDSSLYFPISARQSSSHSFCPVLVSMEPIANGCNQQSSGL